MTANVITYRGRCAVRDVGKALGFDAATLGRLPGKGDADPAQPREAGKFHPRI